jgi:hypothetical protein
MSMRMKIGRGPGALGLAVLMACNQTAEEPASGPPPEPARAPPVGTRAAAPAPTQESPEAPDDATLVGEAPERDPHSETVTIRLLADPARKARVFWGRKDLGLAPLEVTRPRGSGPLDLIVVAPGALTLHTRAFTDRDDKLALRLYRESEGPALLGYRAEPPAAENDPGGAAAVRRTRPPSPP